MPTDRFGLVSPPGAHQQFGSHLLSIFIFQLSTKSITFSSTIHQLNSLSPSCTVNVKEITGVGLFVLCLIDAVICPADLQGLSIVLVPWHIGCTKNCHPLSSVKGHYPFPFLPLSDFLFLSFQLYALVVFQLSGESGTVSGHRL